MVALHQTSERSVVHLECARVIGLLAIGMAVFQMVLQVLLLLRQIPN